MLGLGGLDMLDCWCCVSDIICVAVWLLDEGNIVSQHLWICGWYLSWTICETDYSTPEQSSYVVVNIWHIEVASTKRKLTLHVCSTCHWLQGSFHRKTKFGTYLIQTSVRTQKEGLFIADLLHRIVHKKHVVVDPSFSKQSTTKQFSFLVRLFHLPIHP